MNKAATDLTRLGDALEQAAARNLETQAPPRRRSKRLVAILAIPARMKAIHCPMLRIYLQTPLAPAIHHARRPR